MYLSKEIIKKGLIRIVNIMKITIFPYQLKIKFSQEKLFDQGKKNPTYNKVVEDLYDKNTLDDDIKSIKKGYYEL